MAETPEQKYNRIASAIQGTILTEFPNPDRVGCPGDLRVQEIAERRTLIEDQDWQHITHCSPCYSEFLEHKSAVRSRRRLRYRTLVFIAVVTAAVFGWLVYRALA